MNLEYEGYKTTYNIERADGTNYEFEDASEYLQEKVKHWPSGIPVTLPKGTQIQPYNGKIKFTNGHPEENLGNFNSRRLGVQQLINSRSSGVKTVLAVRVEAANDAYRWSESQLRSFVFGTDSLTLKTGYETCSRNQLTINPATSRNGIGGVSIVNGVITIAVTTSTYEGDAVMTNKITKQLNSVFGVSNPNELADSVMYCLPPNTFTGKLLVGREMSFPFLNQ